MANLKELLDNVLNKCATYFDVVPSKSTPTSAPTTTHVHHHVYHPTPSVSTSTLIPMIALCQPAQQPTVIINNNSNNPEKDNEISYRTISSSSTSKNKKTKSQNNDENIEHKIISVIGGVGLSFLGTYIVSQDKYVKYHFSGIQNEMDKINLVTKPETSTNLNNSFTKWKKLYLQKAKPIFYGKICALLTGFIICGGHYFKHKATMLGGLFGITISGCFLFWKWLTDIDHKTDNKTYQKFKDNVNSLRTSSSNQ